MLLPQAYGCLFKWECVLDGLLDLNQRSWEAVAKDNGHEMPDEDDVMRAWGMRPERAIQQVFRWTNDWPETQKLGYEHYMTYMDMFREHQFEPKEGTAEWLQLLNEYGVPCCLCSRNDRESTELALDKAGLRHLFQEMVTAEDGCETPGETYLVSSVKLKRPPQRCVVLEDDPMGVVAAHDAQIKAIAIMGKHPGHALKNADMRIGAIEDLSLISLREIFRDEAPQ